MRSIVLISHGKMAEGVKSSLEMIIGQQDNVHVVSLKEDGDNIQFENDFLEKMKALHSPVLVIADLLGGTPCNVALKHYAENENVQILAGMSLPLVAEAALNSQLSMQEILALGKASVTNVKEKIKEAEETIEQDKQDDLAMYKEYSGKAKIVNVRIDERLIHGQVAGIWSTSLNTQRIIVVNDEAANDPLQKSTLRMAAPSSMRLSVLPVDKAVKNVNGGKYGSQRLFLLFKNPTDVWRYIEAGGNLTSVNVGNMSFKEGAREVTKSIQVLPSEEDIFRKIDGKGIKITAQLVPNDPIVDFIKKLNS